MTRSAWISLAVLAGWPFAVAAQPAAKAPPLTAQEQLGRQLFTQSCSVCHTKFAPDQIAAIAAYLKTLSARHVHPRRHDQPDARPGDRRRVLSGTVTGQAGDQMGGVTVSAKADGQSMTTSMLTDAAGRYCFPTPPSGTPCWCTTSRWTISVVAPSGGASRRRATLRQASSAESFCAIRQIDRARNSIMIPCAGTV